MGSLATVCSTAWVQIITTLLHLAVVTAQQAATFALTDITDDTISYFKISPSKSESGALLAVPYSSSKPWLSLSNDIYSGFSDELWQRYNLVGVSDFSHSWFKNFTLFQYLYYPNFGSLRIYNYTGAGPTMEMQSTDVFIDYPALSECSEISVNSRVRTGWAIDEKLYCLNKTSKLWRFSDPRRPSAGFTDSLFQIPANSISELKLVYPFGKFKFDEHPIALYTYHTLSDPANNWTAKVENWKMMFLMFNQATEMVIDVKSLILAKGGIPGITTDTIGALLKVHVDRRKIYHDKYLPFFLTFTNTPLGEDTKPEVITSLCNLQIDQYTEGGRLIDIMSCVILTTNNDYSDLLMAEVREVQEDKLFVEIVIKRQQELLPRTLTFNLTFDTTKPAAQYLQNLTALEEIVYPVAAGVSDAVAADLQPSSLKIEASLSSRYIRTTYEGFSVVDYRSGQQFLVYDDRQTYTFFDSFSGMPLGVSLKEGNLIYFSNSVSVKVDSSKNLAALSPDMNQATVDLQFYYKFLQNSTVDAGSMSTGTVSVTRGAGALECDPNAIKDAFEGYQILSPNNGSTILEFEGLPQYLEQVCSISSGYWQFDLKSSSPTLQTRVVRGLKYLAINPNSSNWTALSSNKVWALKHLAVDPRTTTLMTCREFGHSALTNLHLLGCVNSWNFSSLFGGLIANLSKAGKPLLESGKFAAVAEYELPPKEGEEDAQKIRLLIELDLRNKNGAIRNLTNLTGFTKGEFDIGGKVTPNGLYWMVSSDGGRLISLFFNKNGTVQSQLLSTNYKLYAGASLFSDASEPEPRVAATFRTFQNRTSPNQTILQRGTLQSSGFIQVAQRRVNTVEQVCRGNQTTYFFTEYEMWKYNQISGEFRKMLGKEREGEMLYGTCLGTGNNVRARLSTPRQGNIGGEFSQSTKTVRMDKEDFIIMGKNTIRIGTLGRTEADLVESYVEQEDGRFVELHNYGAQLLLNSSKLDNKAGSTGNYSLTLDLLLQGPNRTESKPNSAKVSIKVDLIERAISKQEEFNLGALNFKKTAASQALGTLPEFEARLCSNANYCRDHFWKFSFASTSSNVSVAPGYKATITGRFEVKNYSRAQTKSDSAVMVVSSLGIDVLFDNNQLVASLSGVYSPIAVKDYTGPPVKRLDALDCEYASDGSGYLQCTLVFRVVQDSDVDGLKIVRLDISTRPKILGVFADIVTHSQIPIGLTKRIEVKKGIIGILTYQGSLLLRSVNSKEESHIKHVRGAQFLSFGDVTDHLYVLTLHNFLKLGSQKLGVRMYAFTKQSLSGISDATDSFPTLLNLGLMLSHSCIATSAKFESWSCVFGSHTGLQQFFISAPAQPSPKIAWYRLLSTSAALNQQSQLSQSDSEVKNYDIYKDYRPVKLIAMPTGFAYFGQRDIVVEGDPVNFSPLQGFDYNGLLYYSYGSPFAAGGVNGLDLIQSLGFSGNVDFGLSVQYDYATGEIKKDPRITLFAFDDIKTSWIDVREPAIILQALKSDSVPPKSIDIRLVARDATPSSTSLKYASLSFDSNPNNGGDPAGNSSGLYKTIMYAGAGFGCLMCLMVLVRYFTRSKALERLDGDDSEPNLLAPNQRGVKESVVSLGMNHSTSDNNSKL